MQRWAAVLTDQHAGQVSAAYAKKIEAIAKQPAWWVAGWLDAAAWPCRLGMGVRQAEAAQCCEAREMCAWGALLGLEITAVLALDGAMVVLLLQDGRRGAGRAAGRLPVLRRRRPRHQPGLHYMPAGAAVLRRQRQAHAAGRLERVPQ